MGNPKESDNLANLLIDLRQYLHREMKVRIDQMVNSSQIQALFYIHRHDKPLMSEIAGYLSIQPPSATTLVEELERLKLVERLPDANDRRSVRIGLTDTGETLIQSRLKILTDRLNGFVQPLTPKERSQFIHTIKKILTSLEQNV